MKLSAKKNQRTFSSFPLGPSMHLGIAAVIMGVSLAGLLATENAPFGLAVCAASVYLLLVSVFINSHKVDTMSRKRLAAIEAANDGIGIVDHDGRLIYMNRALMELHGIKAENSDAHIGKGWEKLYSGKGQRDIFEKVLPVLRSQKFWRGESPILRGDGEIIYAEMSLTMLEDGGFIGTARDVTERKKAAEENLALQRQLAQAQKMEAIGRLTGGIAHDFNNLLTVISGNLEILQDYAETLPKLEKPLTALFRATGRGADLTQRLLAFSRKQILKPQVIDMNRIVPETVQLMRKGINERVDIITVLSEEACDASLDIGQFENALLNLAINANDAMPSGGAITIRTEKLLLDDKNPARPDYVQPGAYSLISVGDNGEGIAPEIVSRVFEPFFTTKEVGEGSGLGLSMVYGFVKQSNGYVQIDSKVGEGTKVSLYFPLAQSEKTEAPEFQPADKKEPAKLPHGNEVILLVEDEEDILHLNQRFLAGLGYTVHIAHNGAEGILVLETLHKLDLLLTDVIMPGGIDGRELAREARAQFPDLKVVFVSGYAYDSLVRENPECETMEFLPKPFSRKDLAAALRKSLDASPG